MNEPNAGGATPATATDTDIAAGADLDQGSPQFQHDAPEDPAFGRSPGARIWRWIAIIMTICGVAVVLSQVFLWNPFGPVMLTNQFLYFTLAFFLPQVFIFFRWRKTRVEALEHPDGEAADPHDADHVTEAETFRVPWYDALLVVLTFAVNFYLGMRALDAVNFGWDFAAPTHVIVLSYVLWILVLEALRRTAGLIVTLIALLFSLYPLFSASIPFPVLQGVQYDSNGAARQHSLGVDSILGLPLQTAAALLVGFLIFGVVLQRAGGGDFFVDLARAIFGRARGGSAKVAVGSSAAMGMMSGSAVSNVLTTGPMTIPAMKKAGYPGTYAAGIEATAATGGSITPPIMGTAAFLMVSFLGIPYSEVALAAAIPAFLYYLGIFLQVDAYAARKGLRGEPKDRLPRLLATLRDGWPYLLAIGVLLFLLVVQRDEAQAPFYTVVLMLAIAFARKTDRLSLRGFRDIVLASGRAIAEIIGIIAGVGLIIGGLSMTGVSLSLARELVAAVGENVLLILIAGAITSFVLGMGMTVSAVYVFLSIVMAPALVALDVNPVAAHLFVIYWATASYITPPVALAAFAAAGIAKTPPMKTGFVAMKLGAVKYIIPFCFALNPALVAQDSFGNVMLALALSIVGVFSMASGFEGYMPFVERQMDPVTRILAVAAGVCMLLPEPITTIVGLIVFALITVFLKLRGRSGPEATEPVREPETATA
ncbi:TRAP transporter permease [Blastococcus sp. Marseille-P5729]|uniref:TRAP transporter permease n=1 Tax=Blastococcus sp. Marseille-P5729 TaxID=2086582 RepID=UPI000D0EB7F7|nr:TRAP transporter permease [Blastococcus sp. Marseille-P5729]